MTLTVGSLFSGIGGLDLGLERAGMTVRWQAEVDPYCCRVLAKHWPDVPNLGDVTTVDWSTVERVDLVCGGYPCQPFSLAGGRRGEADHRHLWPYVADALRHLRPRYALMENVAGHLSLDFGRVLGDLAEIGYDAEWDCIPAAAVGAPHRRDRVFVVAYPNSDGQPGIALDAVARPGELVPDAHVADANGLRPREQVDASGRKTDRGGASDRPGNGRSSLADADDGGRYGRPWVFGARGRRQLADCRRWPVEPDVGRVAHGVPARVDRLRALGNAVVPAVAELIGRMIVEADAA